MLLYSVVVSSFLSHVYALKQPCDRLKNYLVTLLLSMPVVYMGLLSIEGLVKLF